MSKSMYIHVPFCDSICAYCDFERCKRIEVLSKKWLNRIVEDIESRKDEDINAAWNKEIFGRKLSELVNDGIKAKINLVPEKAKMKLQESLEKIVNTGNGGLIVIIL